MKLDRHDVNLLGLCSDVTYMFTRGSGQESRAHDLFRAGLLERREQIYSVSRGGRRVTVKWAYRRTAAGTQARVSAPVGHGSTPKETP